MRYFEIAGGLRVPVSGEEQKVLSHVGDKGRVNRADMSDRSQEIARLMVSRGLLRRVRNGDDKEAFIQNNDPPLTRN
jgi:hypothetical protein